jgi:hypothetical protein
MTPEDEKKLQKQVKKIRETQLMIMIIQLALAILVCIPR